MKELIIYLSKEELKELIKLSLREEATSLVPTNQPITEPLLTIEETVKLLQISKVTLHAWKKRGLLPYHRMGRRVYFKKSELLNALHSVNQKKVGHGK